MGTAKSVIGKRGIVASLAIHLALLAALVFLPARIARRAEPPLRVDVIFYPEYPEPEPVAELAPPVPPVAPPVEEPRKVERLPTPTPVPPPTPPSPVAGRPEPASPPPEPTVPARAPSPTVAVPEPTASPAPPRVRTDVLDGPDRPASSKAVLRARTARAGAFDADPTPSAPSRNNQAERSEAAVLDAGFDTTARAQGSGPPAPRDATVLDPGFNTRPLPAPTARTGGLPVRQGGFGDARVMVEPPKVHRREVASLDVPLEILSKPKPAYPERARRLRIEGEVLLEVVFGASGRLRVIRVLKGLGYGLDASAMEAARRINYKPARRDGKPIDYTATLRIVFQLA